MVISKECDRRCRCATSEGKKLACVVTESSETDEGGRSLTLSTHKRKDYLYVDNHKLIALSNVE